MTARAFSVELDREFEATEDELRTVVRRIAFDGLSRIIDRTPVDTGRARGNWFVRVDGPGTDVTTTEDKDGGATIARGSAVIADYKNETGFPIISIYNNLPYIIRLEDGHSKQAPTGMVAVTVTELQAGL